MAISGRLLQVAAHSRNIWATYRRAIFRWWEAKVPGTCLLLLLMVQVGMAGDANCSAW